MTYFGLPVNSFVLPHSSVFHSQQQRQLCQRNTDIMKKDFLWVQCMSLRSFTWVRFFLKYLEEMLNKRNSLNGWKPNFPNIKGKIRARDLVLV